MSFNRHNKKQAAPQQRVRINPFVCTPSYDNRFDGDYCISMFETLQMAAAQFGIASEVGMISNSAFIDITRNRFVHMFLKTKCTHLFFIDSDLRFEPRAFVGLLQAGLPICAGAYRLRSDVEEYPFRVIQDEKGGVKTVETPNGPWVLCDRVPTGFLCIERSVIEEMAADARIVKGTRGEPDVPRLFYTDLLDDGRYLGEDFAFCDEYVRRYKRAIHVWPDFDFTHGRRWKGNWHRFMIEQGKKGETAGNAAPPDIDLSGMEDHRFEYRNEDVAVSEAA